MKIWKWVLISVFIISLGFVTACGDAPSTKSEQSDDNANDDVNDDVNDDDVDDDVDDDDVDDDVDDDDVDDDDSIPPTTTTSTTPATTSTTTTTTSTSTTTSTASVPPGVMRIDLTWGASPSDLDLHMWAPHDGCEDQNPFHLFYPDVGIGHGCYNQFALTLDDTSSYGPETIMIWEPMIDLDYHILVHDYSNHMSCNPPCYQMSNSANLKVVATTSDTYREFHMPVGTSATQWDVFAARFNGSWWEFNPVDRYCYANTTNAVRGCPIDRWIDSESGFTWMTGLSVGTESYNHSDAQLYCQILDWDGYSNWRLPTISELRSLVRGCPAAETGGECGVTDECLQLGNCRDSACDGCPFQEGPGSGGRYWPQEMSGYKDWYWSLSGVSDLPGKIWALEFSSGEIVNVDEALDLRVSCVR